MRLPKQIVRAGAFAGALAASSPAMALTIHDGDSFSVFVPSNAHPCIATADGGPDPSSCASSSNILGPETRGARPIAVGTVRMTEGDSKSSFATFTSVLAKVAHPGVTNPKWAAAYEKGVVDRLVATAPGAQPRPPRVEMQTIRGVAVARVTIDVDRVPAEHRLIEHHVTYIVNTDEGIYSFAIGSSAEDREAADSLVAAIASTMKVAHPAQGYSATDRRWRALGMILAFSVLVTGLLVALSIHRSSRT